MNNFDSQSTVLEKLHSIAKPSDSYERPESLLRFPGPCGLHELAQGSLKTLAPPELETVFLFKDRYDYYHAGIEAFGLFAVINSLSLNAVCLDDDALQELNYTPDDKGRIFLGLNIKAEDENSFFWISPSLYKTKTLWSKINKDAYTNIVKTDSYHREKSEAFVRVNHYMEEVALIEKKVGPQITPWYLQPEAERLSVIESYSLNVRWTKKC